MLGVWSATFIVLGWMRHARFSTFGFDLGIYDQGVWLLSRLKDPFVTVRGLELFGHHVNPVLLAIAPFYRLGGGPELLLVVQVLAQASGAVAVFLLARDRLGGRWTGVAIAAVLLFNPTYQFLTWEYFHPDALAMAPLLFAYWAARSHRWSWFWVSAGLTLACKEDAALAVVVLGILIAVRGHRRIGGLTILVSTAWYLLATRAIIPAFTGLPPFYESFFPQFGATGVGAARGVVTHPGTTLKIALGEDRLSYLRTMLAPFGLLPLFALPSFFIAGPMLLVNLLNVLPFTRDYRFHYSALVAAGGIVAIGEGLESMRDLVRPMVALYVGGMGAKGKNFYNDLACRYGFEKEAALIQDLYLDGKKTEAAAEIPEALLESMTLVGPEGYVKERIAAYRESGVTTLNVTPMGADPVATIETLKAWVD